MQKLIKQLTSKRYIKFNTKSDIKDFIFNSEKNSALQQRYKAKQNETAKTNIDVEKLLRISGLPGNRSKEEIHKLKTSILKYIQFTNILDDTELNKNKNIKCDNIGNPFLKQDVIIDTMDDLDAERRKFENEDVRRNEDLKENTNLNRSSFYTYRK